MSLCLLPTRVSHGQSPDTHSSEVASDGSQETRDHVSLSHMLDYADQHAPGISVAKKNVGLGQAAVEGASPWLPYNPQISAAIGPRTTRTGQSLDYSASLSQKFEIAGERGERLRSARFTKRRFEAELAETRWLVHQKVHATFHQALVARERLAAADRLLKFQEQLVSIAQRRLRAGDIPPLAVKLAQGELSQAEVGRIAAQQTYENKRLELAKIAGWPPEHPPIPIGVLDPPRDVPEFQALLAIASEHQPRLKTLTARQEEASASSDAADRDGWPEPTLGVRYNRESGPPGQAEDIFLGTLSIPLPVVQRNQRARARLKAITSVRSAETDAFRQQLKTRIKQDRRALVAAALRVQTYGSEILPAFEENLRLIRRAFELGEIDVLQVSVARERFLKIQNDALKAYADYFNAVARLEAAIGTDLWHDERHEHEAQP